MRTSRVALSLTAVIAAVALSASPGHAAAGDGVRIPGLQAPASVVRDVEGVPHIKARNVHDLFFLQGWQHAEDRLFQMDVTRRRASGTLAELLGSSALPSDVQMRTLGLRRSAERTMSTLSRKTRDDLRAYADGVNAWIARNRLPGQYASVQVTKAEPWSLVDSVLTLKLVAFSLSFDLDIDRTTAVQAYDAAGLDGRAAVLGDISPFAPFNQASPVIDATRRPITLREPHVAGAHRRVGRVGAGRPDGGALPEAGPAGPGDRRGAQPRRRSRVELMGHRRASTPRTGGRSWPATRTSARTARRCSPRSSSRVAASTPRATASRARRTSSSARTGTSRSA